MVNVFPITTSAFGFGAGWFERFVPQFIQPAYLLMALLLVISIGILALKRFENADLEKKVWNIPVIITLVVLWPFLVLGLKDLVDSFNTFLVVDVFGKTWVGFGWPEMPGGIPIIGWSIEAIARALPNFAYWIVYAFYLIFFFFFAVLGPLILAKGILFDEIECFLELLKEIVILFLWQTTVVILVSFILPDIVSGKPFPPNPDANYFFLCFILGIMILFAPSMTRKFGNHLGSSFFPPGFKWGGAMLGLTAAMKVGSGAMAAVGLPLSHGLVHQWHIWKHRFLTAEEFSERYRHQQHGKHLEHEVHHLKKHSAHGHGGHDNHHDGGHSGHDNHHEHLHHHQHDHSHDHSSHPHEEHQHDHHHTGGHGHSKVVSIFGSNTSKNAFENSAIKNASLALHFKNAPGSNAVNAFGNKLMKKFEVKEDPLLKLTKKAKSEGSKGERQS